MASDPNDPRKLLACTMESSGADNAFWVVVYASSDGGRSWSEALHVDRTSYVGDPDCNYGPDGTAYLVALALHYQSDHSPEMLVYRSPDGGATWLEPTVLPFVDREYVVADHTDGEHHGRIYIHGNLTASQQKTVDGKGKDVFQLFRSDDGGTTFAPPVQLLWEGERGPVGTGNSVILSDGGYVMSYYERDSLDSLLEEEGHTGTIRVLRSQDGGESFAPVVTVSPWQFCRGGVGPGMPYLAVDESGGAFDGRLYLVWPDSRSGRCEILLSYSSDGGGSWSSPIVVNDDQGPVAADGASQHSMPVVAVNNAGVVGISWYDGREHSDDFGWWARFTTSLDGGETFLPSVKVAEAAAEYDSKQDVPVHVYTQGGGNHRPSRGGGPIRSMIGPFLGFFLGGGHTGGMAVSADGVFHPLWIDSRTGVRQLWSAPVRVRGSAMPNGSPDLAELDDFTESIAIDYRNNKLDTKTGTLTLDMVLTNTSDRPLRGPLKVRVIGLESTMAMPRVVNADNSVAGVGAIWDFSAYVGDGVLEPAEQTGPKRVEFLLKELRPFRPGDQGELVELVTKVLGVGSEPK